MIRSGDFITIWGRLLTRAVPCSTPSRDREGVAVVPQPAETHEEAVRPAHLRAAALFPGNLDTEPPCVSKRVFRRPCNARSPAPNRDRQGADVFNNAAVLRRAAFSCCDLTGTVH